MDQGGRAIKGVKFNFTAHTGVGSNQARPIVCKKLSLLTLRNSCGFYFLKIPQGLFPSDSSDNSNSLIFNVKMFQLPAIVSIDLF